MALARTPRTSRLKKKTPRTRATKPKRTPRLAAGARSRHHGELLGIVLLMTAIYLAVSLYSYNANDGDLFIHVAGDTPSNLSGPIGATLAALSYQLVGLSAWIGVLLIGTLGYVRLRNLEIAAPASKLLGVVAVIGFGCVATEYAIGTVSLGQTDLAAGGLLGLWGAGVLSRTLGPVGGPLAAATATLLAFAILTKLSVAWLVDRTWELVCNLYQRILTTMARWSEQSRKQRQRRNVMAKYSERRLGAKLGDSANAAVAALTDSAEAGETGPSAEARPTRHPRRGSATGVTLRVPVRTKRLGAPIPEPPRPIAELAENHEPVAWQRPNLPPPPGDEIFDIPIEMPAGPSPIASVVPETLPFEQPAGPDGNYALPGVDLLSDMKDAQAIDQKELMERAKAITSKAAEFKVTGEVVAIHPGPIVTTFEFRPGTGIKYSRITNLQDDLSLALRAETIRIARLAGKATVGIEVPNTTRATIHLREVFESPEFTNSKSKLTLALGKQIHGENIVADLARMPHLLIAGTTGSGKSVALNCMLLSLLYRATPEEVKVVLIDPKRLEFGLYSEIPHLLTSVVVEPKLAANALSWGVREMERRYKLLAEYGVRSIDQFNLILKRCGDEIAATEGKHPDEIKPLPYIVVIIDELADLMMTSSNVVEEAIIRLSQMARAVGIHLILATQRPSVDVLTGVIKNNLPARLSFRVASKIDSRVILDTQGAECLLGHGDSLFLAPGTSRLCRIHGAFVDEKEVKRIVNFWRRQARPAYEEAVTKPPPEATSTKGNKQGKGRDEYYDDAVAVVVAAGEASVSNIQRKFSLGYARAGRIMDMLESDGVVGPPRGSKPRKVLVDTAHISM